MARRAAAVRQMARTAAAVCLAVRQMARRAAAICRSVRQMAHRAAAVSRSVRQMAHRAAAVCRSVREMARRAAAVCRSVRQMARRPADRSAGWTTFADRLVVVGASRWRRSATSGDVVAGQRLMTRRRPRVVRDVWQGGATVAKLGGFSKSARFVRRFLGVPAMHRLAPSVSWSITVTCTYFEISVTN